MNINQSAHKIDFVLGNNTLTNGSLVMAGEFNTVEAERRPENAPVELYM
jgi:hypothetical protein